MLNRDFEGYERSHELVKLSDDRYTCNRCRLRWKRKPKTFCAGVPVYRYGAWPEGLYTYTQLRRDRSMQPVNREEPQGCSFLRKSSYILCITVQYVFNPNSIIISYCFCRVFECLLNEPTVCFVREIRLPRIEYNALCFLHKPLYFI